jgi:hypothetical protein
MGWVDQIGKVRGKSKANQDITSARAAGCRRKRRIYRGDYGYGHGLSVTRQRSEEV